MNKHTQFRRSIAYVLSLLMLITMMPMTAFAATTPQSGLQTVNPMLVVTGTELLDSGYSSSDLKGISNEKSYTLEELKTKETVSNLYSAINSYDTKSIFLGKGIKLSTLLNGKSVKNIKVVANDGFAKTFDMSATRYYYPNIATGKEDGKKAVEPILAWEEGGEKGNLVSTTTTADIKNKLKFMVGQANVADKNNPMYVSGTNKVLAGEELSTILEIGTKSLRRDELLLMPRADREYTYQTSGGQKKDYVRGVPVSELLKDFDVSSNVKFVCSDGYETKAYTLSDLITKNYILAYEKGTAKNDLTGIYESAKGNASIHGYLTLYGDGDKPVKMISKITIESTSGTDFANSPYKHITNGGNPTGTNKYNVDAITGATLTIEGPGVTKSIPMSVRELENQNSGAFRGEYTDTRNGKSTTLTYEGISLYHVLNNMKSGDSGIVLTNDSVKIEIKNRVRQTIATFTLEQVKEAEEKGKPIIIAYGTGSGIDTRPFVYDGDINVDGTLGNGDGCIKLVYDKNSITKDTNTSYTKFSNMAYIYVSEQEAPGYKHDKAPYNNPENTSFIFSVTGDKIGREINFTVKELEAMTDISHKDEYSLANSNYWYVQEYEGVKLWDLLLKAKLPSNTADNTVVSFTTTDNYKDVQKFTVKQLKDPKNFGYYEKNPADNNDGLYKPTSSDLKDSGYPVLVAYGVNGYPYVVKNTLDGYKSGLGNDGGPFRIIFGKSEYSHANGSQQAKFVDSVVVGNKINYSTHKYNPNSTYQKLANDKISVIVKGIDGNVISNKSYTVSEIEDMIYGSNVSNQEKSKAKVKDFYGMTKGTSTYTDLYEGVNLGYFITEKVGLPGTKGTITFKGQSDQDVLSISIQEALEKGLNTESGKSGLSAVLAFAKNGSPMVVDKNSAGYEKEFVLTEGTVKTIKNDGGPLSVILPQKEDGSSKSLKGVTSIEISLAPDKYAHTSSPYNSLAANKITVSGEGTRLSSPKSFTVSELEGKQNLVFTGDYNIKSQSSEKQIRYRGIDLYGFLNSVDVGLKSNADKVKITYSDNTSYEFSLADIIKKDYINSKSGANNLKVILAYGSAPVANGSTEEGKPLVSGKSDAGYDASYENNGGPIKLVVGQTSATDTNSNKVLKDVVKIEVSAAGITSWTHDINAIYRQYSSEKFTLEVVNGKDVLFNKAYTVTDLEDMQSIIHRDSYTWIGEQEHEGIKVWQLIMQEAGKIAGIDNPTSIKAVASDGFSKDILSIFGKDALENGVKDGEARKPIILAYSANGYPLVPTEANDGYVGTAGNAYGPIRLITHGNQGACLKNTVKILVELSGEATKPVEQFTVYEATDKKDELPGVGVRSISFDNNGGMWVGTYGGGAAYLPKAADKFNLFNKVSNPALNSLFAVEIEPDSEGGVWISQSGSYSDESTNKSFGAAYFKDNKITYYNADKKDTLPHNYVQEIKIDNNGNVWFGSFGGLTRFNKKTGEWKTWTKKDGLPAESVDNIEFDSKGGVWVGCYPDTNKDANGDITYTGGYAYIDANGKVTSYVSGVNENTNSKLLADSWVRDIAVDANGGAWIVRSGSYRNMTNVGGRIDYVSPEGDVTHYTGQRLLNGKLTANVTVSSEIRTVNIDKNGGLWFGTTADGVFYCTKPYDIVRNYSSKTMYWQDKEAFNNIYAVEFKDDAVYLATAGGVLTGKADYVDNTASNLEFLGKLKEESVKAKFNDVNNHWAEEYIYYLANRGIINGTSNSKFEPEANITRAQFIKILAYIANIDAGQFATNKFEPNDYITREEIALMVYRMVNYTNFDLESARATIEFLDDAKINNYSYGAIQNLYSAKLIDGIKINAGYAYNPQGYATRGETCKIVALLLKSMLK